MIGAVGSTFGGGGLGSLFLLILYGVFGPGWVLFQAYRWGLNKYSCAVRGRATLRLNEMEAMRKYVPWNIGISLLPFIPYLWDAVTG